MDDEDKPLPSQDYDEFPVTLVHEFAPSSCRLSWRPYFKSRTTRLAKERPSTTTIDNGSEAFYSASRRVLLPDGSTLPTLMKPSLIEGSTKINKNRNRYSVMSVESGAGYPQSGDDSGTNASDIEPYNRPSHPISLNIGSRETWTTRSNSVRLPKSQQEPGRGANKRNISPPLSHITTQPVSSHRANTRKRGDTLDSSTYQQKTANRDRSKSSPRDFQGSIPNRARNISSPLPSISRLSSFNLDLSDLNTSFVSNPKFLASISPTSLDDIRTVSRPSSSGNFKGLSSHPVVLHQHNPPRLSELHSLGRASTLVGSDSDAKAITFGEDDETDFQSDTAYDSLRTGATASLRARSTPLDSMFDESPPSSGPRFKAVELNDVSAISGIETADDSILEEDETMATPIKSRRRLYGDVYGTPVKKNDEIETDHVVRSSPPSFCLATTEFDRLSMGDDDDDEDWTRDDDSVVLKDSLSPPSNLLSVQRLSHALPAALMDVTKSNSLRNNRQSEVRPRSLFDWSEPLMPEKVDNMGNSPRPKTVHGKQATDGRGGRIIGRSRPNALHIRSQSVPALADIGEHRDTELAPKFGTWGLGAKGVSEDWDNDFEFDNVGIDGGDDQPITGNGGSMLVPPAIRASQANVVGHVGQIREVCLLVEDLKRLRGLAREKGLLDGPSADKWREAEGIIALAIPDEEDETLSSPQSPLLTSLVLGGGHQNHHNMAANIGPTRDSGFEDDGDRPTRFKGVFGNARARRRSVFSPEDDIFGSSLPRTSLEEAQEKKISHRHQVSNDTVDVARSVMQNIHQHRANHDPVFSSSTNGTSTKMPFDTTSLKDLVQRANALARALSEIIRKADGLSQSPYRSPHLNHDSSPAFTRVFTDPIASPSNNIHQTQSSNSVLNTTIDSSPTRNLGQCMQLMTVV